MQTTPTKNDDHETITAWVKSCYAAGPGGIVVVPAACMLRLKNGKEYLMPRPPPHVWDHVRRIGDDADGRPLYESY